MSKHTCRCTCTAYGGHCDCWFHGNVKGKDEGAAEERARIVEWLRGPLSGDEASDIADAIEREDQARGEQGR